MLSNQNHTDGERGDEKADVCERLDRGPASGEPQHDKTGTEAHKAAGLDPSALRRALHRHGERQPDDEVA